MKPGELKRGKGLKSNPEQVRDWQNRSRKPLPAKSEKREEESPERDQLVRRVLREHPTCAAAIPFCCTGMSSEVNEIIRRGQWSEGFLVHSNTEALCHNCHAFITVHPDWAKGHGHQLEGADRFKPNYIALRHEAWTLRAVTRGHDVTCKIDHRDAS